MLWIAPGSTDAAELPERWRSRGIRAIGEHHGPLGAVLVDHDGTLLVATDPLGTMPVFWARTSEGLLAVSTVIAELVDRADVDDRIDYEGVVIDSASSLRGTGAEERTRFRAVSVVPFGSAARLLPDGRSRLERIWSPEDVEPPDDRRSFGDCVELLRSEIDAAVRRRPASVVVAAADHPGERQGDAQKRPLTNRSHHDGVPRAKRTAIARPPFGCAEECPSRAAISRHDRNERVT